MNKLDTPGGEVSVAIDGDPTSSPLVVLAHGAGADMNSGFMERFAGGLAERDCAVARFNFLYTERGKKAPDKQALLEETYAAVVDGLVGGLSPATVVIGGKSLGGRIASHVAIGRSDVGGLVFLGYPLHPPGRPERIRDEHLHQLEAPMLFVEGTRDPFCPLDTLEKVRKSLPARSDLVVIDDGDHSLKVRKSSGRTTEEAWEEAIAAVAGWVKSLA